ncbi:MAG TPA: FMN-binding negative transcriptional regulator, partial [Microvirga sp.]|nr:FMN-binding negative transcriptional regulator [Microvirga sp.]
SAIHDFVEETVFGSAVAWHAGALASAHLVFTLDRTAGPNGTLTSHVPVSDPFCEAVRARAPAVVVFKGPDGYVSSSWYSDRTSAPTWNFLVAEARGPLEPVERSVTARHLAELVRALEGRRAGAWRLDEIGHRFPSMLDRLLGFRIAVTDLQAKFKMHQDERLAEVRDAISGALRTGRPDLAELMGRFNAARLRNEGGA